MSDLHAVIYIDIYTSGSSLSFISCNASDELTADTKVTWQLRGPILLDSVTIVLPRTMPIACDFQ